MNGIFIGTTRQVGQLRTARPAVAGLHSQRERFHPGSSCRPILRFVMILVGGDGADGRAEVHLAAGHMLKLTAERPGQCEQARRGKLRDLARGQLRLDVPQAFAQLADLLLATST